MKKGKILRKVFFIGSIFSVLFSSAQNNEKDEKQIIKLQAKISEDSAKLVKFNSLVADYEKQKRETAEQAQQSADDNKRAAEKLSNDPQDRKLARRADNAASDARSDAKKARVAADKLDDLNLDIKKLTKQLEKERDKLGQYLHAVPVPVAAQKDSLPN
jgi:predicted  nucleic acid-binding Zn-ribbon protein